MKALVDETTVIRLLVGVEWHGPPGREAEFDRWYTEVHSPYMLELGALHASRYHLIQTMPGFPPDAPRYLAIYEFRGRDKFDAWVAEGLATGKKQRTDKFTDEEFVTRWSAAYEEVWSAPAD